MANTLTPVKSSDRSNALVGMQASASTGPQPSEYHTPLVGVFDGAAKKSTSSESRALAQPWRAIWPNTETDQDMGRRYGFKQGERLRIMGNAASFFTDGNWAVDYEAKAPEQA